LGPGKSKKTIPTRQDKGIGREASWEKEKTIVFGNEDLRKKKLPLSWIVERERKGKERHIWEKKGWLAAMLRGG